MPTVVDLYHRKGLGIGADIAGEAKAEHVGHAGTGDTETAHRQLALEQAGYLLTGLGGVGLADANRRAPGDFAVARGIERTQKAGADLRALSEHSAAQAMVCQLWEALLIARKRRPDTQ